MNDVTEAQVEAACEAFNGPHDWDFQTDQVKANTRVAMRRALEAAQSPTNPHAPYQRSNGWEFGPLHGWTVNVELPRGSQVHCLRIEDPKGNGLLIALGECLTKQGDNYTLRFLRRFADTVKEDLLQRTVVGLPNA